MNPTLEKIIAAILDGTLRHDPAQPTVYSLPTGETASMMETMNYFFDQYPCGKDLYVRFFEAARTMEPRGFLAINYFLDKWIERRFTQKFYDISGTQWKRVITRKPEVSPGEEDQEVLSFIVYVGICYVKYGESYQKGIANTLFDRVTELGSKEVAQLKKTGTGKLPKELIDFQGEGISCKGNDVFSTIKIKISQDTEALYRRALEYLVALLRAGFPKSFSIEFSSPGKALLPIKGLPKCGQNALFAGALPFPDLQGLIREYIRLSQNKWEWYSNLEEEQCALPSTFAVFGLALHDESYFPEVLQYFRKVDGEHQSLQQYFTPAFAEKFGITQASLPIILTSILSVSDHPFHKVFPTLFQSAESLDLLLAEKANLGPKYFPERTAVTSGISPSQVDSLLKEGWKSILDALFGEEKNREKWVKSAPKELQPKWREVLTV